MPAPLETLNSYGILSRPRVWRPENGAQGSTFPCRFIKARRESHHRSRRNPCTRAEAERNGEARRCSGVGRAPAAKGRVARQRHPMGTAARAVSQDHLLAAAKDDGSPSHTRPTAADLQTMSAPEGNVMGRKSWMRTRRVQQRSGAHRQRQRGAHANEHSVAPDQ